MDNKAWIEENIKDREDGDVSISCGHDNYNYFVPLSDYEPHVYFVLCTACYQRILGFFFEEIRTIKFGKLRL